MAEQIDNLKNFQEDDEYVCVLLSTKEHIIKGKLYLPDKSCTKNPTIDNLIFYVLNCGNMFITLKDVSIASKQSVEFTPEFVPSYNINLNIVNSCRVINEDDVQYGAKMIF